MDGKRTRSVKDPADKSMLKKPVNFASLFNLALTGGKEELIKPEDLVECDPNKVVFFDAQGNTPTGERRMDIEKEWLFKAHKEGGLIFAIRLHMEIQSTNDYFMPVRALVYSAAEYDAQLKKGKRRRAKGDKLIPVLPLLTNLSLKKWKGYKTLQECFRIPLNLKQRISRFIPDFQLLQIEPTEGMDYSHMPPDVRITFGVLSVAHDARKVIGVIQKEKILNGISDEAYNVINARVNISNVPNIKEGRTRMPKRVDIMDEYEKQLKRELAEVAATKGELRAEKSRLIVEKNELKEKENGLIAEKNEIDSKLRNTVENLLKRGFSYKEISDISGLDIQEVDDFALALA